MPALSDGFIEQEALDEGDDARRRYAADNQRLDRLRREQEDKSAEQLAEELNERYRRTARYAAQSDYAEVPQRLLMPSVDDPKLWCVKCKIGRERDIVMTLMRKQDAMGGALRFISAFCRDSLPGRMYVESRSAADVLEAVIDIVGCYARGESQLQMVPIGEMADLLKITKLQPTVKIGGWVRLKRGKYTGDLAQVIDQAENGEDVGIKFVPRIDMNPRETGDTFIDKNGRKRKKTVRGFADRGPRPQQRFFNPDEVRKVYSGGDRPVKRGEKEWVFQKDTFRDGYCERDVRIDHLVLEDVKPSLDEITKFSGASVSSGQAGEAAAAAAAGQATNAVDLEMLANAAKETSTTTLERDDAVEVFEGDLTGVQGIVQKISGNIITILFDDKEMLGQTAEVPARSVRKRFKPGDHVKVTTGKHQDETGLVVKTEDSFTTFLSDLTLSEVTVFSKDLRQATEVGSGVNDIAGYELHNLVQLDAQTAGVIFKIERESFRVLDQLGNVLSVRPHQISMKRDTMRAVALDNEGAEFRAGDKMKEVEGEHREGQVLHIYQSVLVFMHNRDVSDNGGVFISRARQLVPVAPKSAAFGNSGGMKGADLSKQNPQLTAGLANAAQVGGGGGAASSMRRMGRDPLQGKAVSIIKGPYKTYRGIIKDTNGPMARVELHTMAKILTIDLKFLVEKDPMTGKSRPLLGQGPAGSAGGAPGSMGPPRSMGTNPYSQAPRAGANPYATPYGGMGGATPYGNATPAYGAYGSGSKTPAYGGAGAGGKTPAHPGYDGSKTPAYSGFAGGKTPNPYASMDGSKTPAYNGFGGGKTPNPYASMDGSKTPYGGDMHGGYGGATPGWRPDNGSNGADSRRSYGDNPYASANTPYGAAPTPGAYGAPTPGAYGSAPTPAVGAYGAPTPGATPGMWGAPTPGGAALSAPTPGGPLSGPTPGGAPTPWAGAHPSAAHQPSGVQGTDKPLAETLVRIAKDMSGASYQGGRFDRSTGAVTGTTPDGEQADVQLDGGELLRDVPAKFISPQRPDRTGELCLVTLGPLRGRSARVASVDANEFMVTLEDKSMHVLPPGALAKKA